MTTPRRLLPPWLIPRRLMIALGVAMLVAGFMQAAAPGAARAQFTGVQLVIDYGNGARKIFSSIAWRPGMTVLDAMEQVRGTPPGAHFVYSGSGAAAFLSEIDSVRNEGGGADKRNWLYWVNMQLGQVGFGAYVLRIGDVVFWRFAKGRH